MPPSYAAYPFDDNTVYWEDTSGEALRYSGREYADSPPGADSLDNGLASGSLDISNDADAPFEIQIQTGGRSGAAVKKDRIPWGGASVIVFLVSLSALVSTAVSPP